MRPASRSRRDSHDESVLSNIQRGPSVFPSKIPPLFCVFRVWDTPHVFRSFRVPHALRRSFLEGGDFEVLVNTGTQGRLTQARESWRERPASRRPPDPQGPRRGAESEGLFHGKLEKAARAFLSATRPPESCFESTSFLLGLAVPTARSVNPCPCVPWAAHHSREVLRWFTRWFPARPRRQLPS